MNEIEYIKKKEQTGCVLDKYDLLTLANAKAEPKNKNKAFLVEYVYTDEIDEESSRTSYIVVVDPETELGSEVQHYLDSDAVETDFVRLDNVLMDAFDITDNEVCFYIVDSDPALFTTKGMAKEVLDANDMIVRRVLEEKEED